MQIIRSYDKETKQWIALNAIEQNTNSGNTELDTSQVNSLIDTKLSPINSEISSIKEKNNSQDSEISYIKEKNNSQDSEISSIKEKNNSQDTTISNLTTRVQSLEERPTSSGGLNESQVNNLIDSKLTSVNNSISSINSKNDTQDTNINTNKNNIGTLTSLNTSAKGNLVSAINELFTSASSGKRLVANAITGKGVPTSPSDTFATMANNIEKIETNGNSDIAPVNFFKEYYNNYKYCTNSIFKLFITNNEFNKFTFEKYGNSEYGSYAKVLSGILCEKVENGKMYFPDKETVILPNAIKNGKYDFTGFSGNSYYLLDNLCINLDEYNDTPVEFSLTTLSASYPIIHNIYLNNANIVFNIDGKNNSFYNGCLLDTDGGEVNFYPDMDNGSLPRIINSSITVNVNAYDDYNDCIIDSQFVNRTFIKNYTLNLNLNEKVMYKGTTSSSYTDYHTQGKLVNTSNDDGYQMEEGLSTNLNIKLPQETRDDNSKYILVRALNSTNIYRFNEINFEAPNGPLKNSYEIVMFNLLIGNNGFEEFIYNLPDINSFLNGNSITLSFRNNSYRYNIADMITPYTNVAANKGWTIKIY